MEKMQESINKDLEELSKHTETNNIITDIKYTLEGINSGISEAERISELEDKMVEITSEEQNKVKRMKRTEDSLRDLWDNIKCTNIWITGVPGEKEKVWENFWRDYSWKFPQHGKGDNQIQEAQRVPYRINPRRNMLRHILIKLTKTKHKEKILKAAREKQQVTYMRNPIRFSSVQFSHSVMSDSLRPQETQHTRPPCPSSTHGVYPNPCPLSRWCHPAISSSVVPFSSCPQFLPVSGSFPMSQLFAWGGQSTGVSASASVLPMITQDWSPLGWTGWISLQSKRLSRIFSNTN